VVGVSQSRSHIASILHHYYCIYVIDILSYEQVLWLDVPVDDLSRMAIGYSLQELIDILPDEFRL
jgi:hypothetical protein